MPLEPNLACKKHIKLLHALMVECVRSTNIIIIIIFKEGAQLALVVFGGALISKIPLDSLKSGSHISGIPISVSGNCSEDNILQIDLLEVS